MGAARLGFVGNALGSLAVLIAVVFIAYGLPVVDHSLPAGRPVAAGAPFVVGAGVTVTPPVNATMDLSHTRPADDRGTALLMVNGVRLAIVVAPFHGSLDDAAARLRGKITNNAGYQVTGADRPVRTAMGVTGLRGAYNSPGRLGEYAVFVSDGLAVEVTASGPENELRVLVPALDASLTSLSFRGGA